MGMKSKIENINLNISASSTLVDIAHTTFYLPARDRWAFFMPLIHLTK
jgi:hypothetical protein